MSLALDIIVIIMIIMYSFMCYFSTEIGAHSPSQSKEQNTVKRNFPEHAHTCTHAHTHTHIQRERQQDSWKR